MSSYQYPSPFADAQYWPQADMSSEASDPKAVLWVPVLVPFWEYPPTLYYAQEHSVDEQPTTDVSLPPASCQASPDASDSYSDASTDVGDDDCDVDDDCDEQAWGQNSPTDLRQPRNLEVPRERVSFFAKLSRKQRVDQLRRVVDEFFELEFESVDASSQGALSLRLLTILKSLREMAVYHDDASVRCEEKRFTLLGLSKCDEIAIEDTIARAEKNCEERAFRKAFDVLKEAAPRLRRQAMPVLDAMVEDVMPPPAETVTAGTEKGSPMSDSKQMSAADREAMDQRRAEKRQRQRQERRSWLLGQHQEHRAHRKSQDTGLSCRSTTPSSSGIEGMKQRHPDQRQQQGQRRPVDTATCTVGTGIAAPGRDSKEIAVATGMCSEDLLPTDKPVSDAERLAAEATAECKSMDTEPMSAADMEAMKQRRLEKRQRQRQERREQRTVERNERSALRYKPPRRS